MNRLHVHLSVADIDRSVAFYTALFAAEPTVLKPDYARWMVDDPRVNFAISSHSGEAPGVSHLGIQAEDTEGLASLAERAQQAGGPVQIEGETTCCYANSTKGWTADPDGVAWEAFLTHGESESFGRDPDLAELSQTGGEGACCGNAS